MSTIKLVIKMRKYLVSLIVLIIITLGFFTGTFIYKINTSNKQNKYQVAELIEDECTYLGEIAYQDGLVSASSSEEKTSPNCMIVLKMYYKKCGHIVEKKKEIEEAYVNLTEEELSKKISDWEIQRFTPTEIVLYKEIDDFCKEHYVLKEKEGNIAIFSLDENNNETFLETTDISTKYLTREDLDRIKNGIVINSKKELNETLEDFE